MKKIALTENLVVKITFPKTRYIQIDIDDIFVGSARLTKEDVVALIQSQNNIAKNAPGFRYLGFLIGILMFYGNGLYFS